MLRVMCLPLLGELKAESLHIQRAKFCAAHISFVGWLAVYKVYVSLLYVWAEFKCFNQSRIIWRLFAVRRQRRGWLLSERFKLVIVATMLVLFIWIHRDYTVLLCKTNQYILIGFTYF